MKNEISDDDYVAKVTRLWDLDKNEKKKKNFFLIFFWKFLNFLLNGGKRWGPKTFFSKSFFASKYFGARLSSHWFSQLLRLPKKIGRPTANFSREPEQLRKSIGTNIRVEKIFFPFLEALEITEILSIILR